MEYYNKWLQLYSYVNCLESENIIVQATADDMRRLLDSLKLPLEEADELDSNKPN